MSPLTRPVTHLLPLAEDTPNLTDAGNTQIVLAVLLGIAAVVVAIDADAGAVRSPAGPVRRAVGPGVGDDSRKT